MVQLRHRGCKTPIFEYSGETPLTDGPTMRAKDWKVFGVQQEGYCALMPAPECPDCGARVPLKADMLETCDGSPHRYKLKPKEPPKQPTLWERLKALFSF